MRGRITDEMLIRRLRAVERRQEQLHNALLDLGHRLPQWARESRELGREIGRLATLVEPEADDAVDDKTASVQPAAPSV